ncbi:MAG: NUDIX domain-containing protein [Bacteroidales bacterium]|nr:NUDIX domain-containing protein [Bacteroidales bacterium]MBN2756284.1 NUDIX domain-containing protein [Bacteroidales bacterium]
MSNAAWAFISSALLYILFGLYFVFEFVSNKLKFSKLNSEEILPIVDENGQLLGTAPRSVCHKNNNLLHPVIHVHFFNEKGEIFLQKRTKNKLIQPDKWDTAVGGHVSAGETIEQAREKEVREELGITVADYQFIGKYIWKSEIESELVFVFFGNTNQEIKINKDEISDGKFWSINEITKCIDNQIITPNFENEFKNLLLPILKKNGFKKSPFLTQNSH